jgi:hypothetical protein
MPRGPKIRPHTRQLIARVHYEHLDWTAKEVQHEVNASLVKGHPDLSPDWPGLSAVQKELSKLRKSPSPQDNSWNVSSLNELELPPEALPAVIQVWFNNRVNNSRRFTVREAKWVARLYCIIKDIDELTRTARGYAYSEYITEQYGSRFAIAPLDYHLFEIMTGRQLSDDEIDKLLDEPYKSAKKMLKESIEKNWRTEEYFSRAAKRATELGFMKNFRVSFPDLINLNEEWWEK